MNTRGLQEPQLFLEQNMAEAEMYSVAGGSAAVFSTRCPGKTSPNEDAAALIPVDAESAVLVVADGLGGEAAGELAAETALRSMCSAIADVASQGVLLRTAILNGFECANQAVGQIGIGAATTLAAVEISKTEMRPYHVGDSLILLIGGRGRIKLETIAHAPVAYAVAAGVLDAHEAMHHEDRHLVSNVIGCPGMRIEIGPTCKLAPRDTVLLASDGLVDNLHIHEIVDRIRKGPLPISMQQLVDDALQRMTVPAADQPSKPDDLSCIVFRQRR